MIDPATKNELLASIEARQNQVIEQLEELDRCLTQLLADLSAPAGPSQAPDRLAA